MHCGLPIRPKTGEKVHYCPDFLNKERFCNFFLSKYDVFKEDLKNRASTPSGQFGQNTNVFSPNSVSLTAELLQRKEEHNHSTAVVSREVFLK